MADQQKPLPPVSENLPVNLVNSLRNDANRIYLRLSNPLDSSVNAADIQEILRRKLNNPNLIFSGAGSNFTISGIKVSDPEERRKLIEEMALFNIKFPVSTTFDRTALLSAHKAEVARIDKEIKDRVAAASQVSDSNNPTQQNPQTPQSGQQNPQLNRQAPGTAPEALRQQKAPDNELRQFFSVINAPEDLDDPEKLTLCLGLSRENLNFIAALPNGEAKVAKMLEDSLDKVLTAFASAQNLTMKQGSLVRALALKVNDPTTIKKI
jgi:hypothetical protein